MPKDGKCKICGLPTNSICGNPSLWSLELEYPNGHGKRRIYHRMCVVKAVAFYSDLIKKN